MFMNLQLHLNSSFELYRVEIGVNFPRTVQYFTNNNYQADLISLTYFVHEDQFSYPSGL